MGKTAEKIRAEIERRKMSVTDAASRLHIGRPALSNVVNGNAGLSIELALKLQKHFGMNAKKLLLTQLNEELAAAQDKFNG